MRNNPRLATQTITHCTIASTTYWHLRLAITKIFFSIYAILVVKGVCFIINSSDSQFLVISCILCMNATWFYLTQTCTPITSQQTMLWSCTSCMTISLHEKTVGRINWKLDICVYYITAFYSRVTHMYISVIFYILCLSDHPRLRPCLKDAPGRAGPGIKVASPARAGAIAGASVYP